MQFVKGLELSRMLYEEEIRPAMAERFPGLPYAAATLGMCSEVLGLDDEVSTDHEWGPRVTVFVAEDDHAGHAAYLRMVFQESFPTTFKGIPMMWRTPGVDLHDTRQTALYHVSIRTVPSALGFCGGLAALPLQDVDWLAVSEQHLLEFTSGAVYRDDAGELTQARESLRYYPDNVLRFLLMHEWGAVNGEWFPIGRMGSRGDGLGVRLQTARVAQRLMRIAFMVSRRYIPYKKWLGTLFRGLPVAPALEPILLDLLNQERWQAVEERICEAASLLIERQNALRITPAIAVEPETVDDGRHHMRCGFREVWEAVAKAVRPPLDALMENRVFWLHERSLILANDEVGKWSVLLQK